MREQLCPEESPRLPARGMLNYKQCGSLLRQPLEEAKDDGKAPVVQEMLTGRLLLAALSSYGELQTGRVMEVW